MVRQIVAQLRRHNIMMSKTHMESHVMNLAKGQLSRRLFFLVFFAFSTFDMLGWSYFPFSGYQRMTLPYTLSDQKKTSSQQRVDLLNIFHIQCKTV